MPTLFDRLGGVPAMRISVDEFCERIQNDAKLSDIFDEMSGAKYKLHHLKLFKVAFGKESFEDAEETILRTHRIMFSEKGLSAAHFDLLILHLVATLQHLGIKSDHIAEATSKLAPLRQVFEIGARLYGN